MDILQVLHSYGLRPSEFIADEQIHRCGTDKKPHGKNGWYIGYEGGAAAVYGNWENGDGYEYWQSGDLSPVDSLKIRKAVEKLKEDKLKLYSESAQKAIDYFESCASDGYSDYLKNKRIYPHGAKFDGSTLVIPAQDASGKIWTYQKIYGDGSKYFMQGGKVSGCYFPIFKRNIAKDELVVVCEGFATGASIHQETGLPVVVAFNAGNLKSVCDSIVYRNIIIAADNDTSGVGEKYAKESGYKYVMPDNEGWDFSDVFLNGKDVKKYFSEKPSNSKKKSSDKGAHGLVGEIAEWITATAVRPQPELSLAAAIAFVGMMKGHRIKGRTNLRTNTLCLALAPTAAGKEHPQFAIDKLATACGLSKHMMGRPTSGTALLTGLEKAGRIGMLSVDEMGRYIGNITAKGAGGFQREIADYMVELFSSAGRTFRGRQYAKEKENPQVIIEQPHFCCLGSTVPERLQAACSSAEVVDGFLNRWLVFSTNQRPQKLRIEVDKEPPSELVNKVCKWLEQFPMKSDNYGSPQPIAVTFTPEAWDIFTEFDDKMEKSIDGAIYPMDKLYSRSAEHVEKLALILTDDEFIGTNDVLAAIDIVERSNGAIMAFSGMIADNVNEQDFIRVKEKIRDAREVKRSWLTYNCQFVQGGAKRISEIVAVLLEENVISERKVGNKTFYKWIG